MGLEYRVWQLSGIRKQDRMGFGSGTAKRQGGFACVGLRSSAEERRFGWEGKGGLGGKGRGKSLCRSTSLWRGSEVGVSLCRPIFLWRGREVGGLPNFHRHRREVGGFPCIVLPFSRRLRVSLYMPNFLGRETEVGGFLCRL